MVGGKTKTSKSIESNSSDWPSQKTLILLFYLFLSFFLTSKFALYSSASQNRFFFKDINNIGPI